MSRYRRRVEVLVEPSSQDYLTFGPFRFEWKSHSKPMFAIRSSFLNWYIRYRPRAWRRQKAQENLAPQLSAFVIDPITFRA